MNDGTIPGPAREDFLRQLERSAQADVENMLWSEAYAEGQGEPQPTLGVLFANWNVFPTELPGVLQRAGYEVEWSDEWTTCDECNKALRVQPDCHSWTPAYKVQDEAYFVCFECLGEGVR